MVAKLLAAGVADIAAALPPSLIAFMEATPAADADGCADCGMTLDTCICVVPCDCGSHEPGSCRCLAETLCAEVVL